MRTALTWPLIAAGGAVGTLARWAVIGVTDPGGWSWPILVVNVVGSAMLGWSVARRDWAPLPVTTAFGVGVCGGLTTMSTFAVDVAELVREDRLVLAGATLLTTVGAGLGAAALGLAVGRHHRTSA